LPDLPIAATFAPGDPERDLGVLHALRPDGPLICGEYWAGWFDHWGEPHQRTDALRQAVDLEWMLEHRCSANIYMFHGGTNFGFWNGANTPNPAGYQPDTTSYDYDAALDEAGRPSEKFLAFREIVSRVRGTPLRPIPEAPRTIAIPEFALNAFASLDDLLFDEVECDVPIPMERLAQSFGYVLYRTVVAAAGSGRLEIEGMRDYAVVSLNGSVVGHLDRRLGQTSLALDAPRAGMQLDILVENGGRVNYGPHLGGERKGIEGVVRWEGRELRGWTAFRLPLDDLAPLRFQESLGGPAPAFRRGMFELDEPADTFIDVRSLNKGALWINRRNVGRFWNIGPQGSLYVPGVWLKRGTNEVIAFDLFDSQPILRGRENPVWTVPQ
jgi:beta-galactosidase